MQLLTINDAATLTGKSIQTIRRMIKQKKVHVKRQKTPQGFNYLIIKESLDEFLDQTNTATIRPHMDIQPTSREHRSITQQVDDPYKKEVERFSTTIQKLIEQHEKDKENLFQLLKNFQDRVGTLESQIKLLEAPTSWWKFW